MFSNNENRIFDIRFHIEKLTSAKGKNRYQCPVCEGGNLTVNPATGKYQCWNGCECRDIREAIAPWDERKSEQVRVLAVPVESKLANPKGQNRSLPHPKRQVRVPKPQPAPIPDAPIKLSRFQASAIIHCQDPQNTIYPYSDTQWVERVCQKNRKLCFPHELDNNGIEQIKKLSPQWTAYRESEVIQYGKRLWVLGVEGEKCVEAARSLGIVTFTMQGSDWDKALESAVARFKQADISGVIYFPDNDKTGRKKAQAVQDACALAKLPCIVINPTELNPDAPQKWDIADWVSESNLSPDAMVRIIEATAEGERLAVGGEGMPIVNGEAIYSEDERLIGNWVKDGANVADILQQVGEIKRTSTNDDLTTKSIVYVDNGLLSTPLSTHQSHDESKIQAIVGIVYTILASNNSEFVERQKLNSIFNQYKGYIDRKLFESIVASERVKAGEVLPEDELRLKSLMDYSQTRINWDEVLPAPLARDIKHDAERLNIDPVMIWQALLPAVSSLAGAFTLDEYGGVPAINWTCTVLPSGGGKTRADSLVFSPLRSMQLRADDDYKERAKEYKRAIVQYEKAGDFEAIEPEKPGLRKYLFEVATIQSVLKRLSEQGNKGSLWGRDEIRGLFNSLNQFSGSETEGVQLVLKIWDGREMFIDRADIENSYSIPRTAVSLAGGIQNDIFRKVFKDASDSDGMQARFLFAVPEQRKKQYTPGAYCRLSDRLPALYEWLDNLNPETVKIAPDAQKYFAKIVGIIGDQIEQISHAGIRTWMNKLDTHILRISLALHLIECYYSPSTTDIKTLSLATLKRAVAFAQYYRSAFHVLQEKVSTSDDIASIMLQIHAAALSKHPDGISVRDVYKDSRPIQNRAKSAGRETSAYVTDLFEKMAQMGYGEVVRKGRSVRFVAFQKSNLEKDFKGADNVDNSQKCNQEPLYSEEKDCLHDRRQYPIVYVDNQNITEVRTEVEYQYTLQKEKSKKPALQPVVEAHKAEEPVAAFKVGDRVTILDPTNGQNELLVATKESSESVTEFAPQMLPESPTESPTTIPDALIGKTVTIASGGRFDGLQGVVQSFDPRDKQFAVAIAGHSHKLWFEARQLNLV